MTTTLPILGQTPDDQLFDPTRSWVVTAGAGTGKTWRLVRRYVRCLQHLDTEGLSASHMLAVTFTRAAAAEMRGRVLRALLGHEAADPAQDEVLAGVQSWPAEKRERLAADVADAPIETLHSFCARLLSSLPELSGVAPGVRPIEPSQDALRRDAFVRRFVDDVLEGHRAELQVDASEVLREYSLVELRKMLSACITAADMPPAELTDAQAVAAARWKLYGPQLEEWGQRLRTAFEAACLQLEQVAGPKAQSRLGDLSQLRDALRAGNWNAAFCMKKPGRNADVRRVETEAGPAFDAAWKVMLERSKFRGNATLVKLDTDAENIHCERLARTMRLGLAARRAYEDHLAAEGLMRFDDLEHRAVELLQRPEAREWLVGRYRHLLVDEFQDTSPLQLKLVQALREVCAGDGSPVSVFEVGDVKQSIYRFRGAEVAMFEGELRRAPANQRGHLSMTRRTEPALAAFFNQMFPRLLQGVPGEDPDRAEVPWGEGDVIQTSKNASTLPGKPVTLLLSLPVEPMSEEDDVERPETPAEGESSADEDEDEALDDGDPGEPSRIAAWLSLWFKQADKVRYSDVAILLPKWDSAEPIRAALEAYGIPAQVSG
ncbi:MAG: UvrD-helicase domain-containing protein, partial [Myxococcota bacterium]